MAVEMVEPNTCIRGCCRSESIPLHLPPSSFSLSSPIARGAESVVYEATLDGKKVAVKKPVLSTSDHLDKFHKELQLLWSVEHPGIAALVAAHAKPPNYMFFFELYEAGSLAQKLHVEEWTPGVDQALAIALQLAKALRELLTGVVPYTDIRAEAQAHTVLEMNYTEQRLTAAVVSEGLRPLLAGLESGTPARLLSLIQRCWDMNPNNRPSFQDIVVELDLIVENNGTTKLEKKAFAEHSTSPSGQNKMNFRAYQESINWLTLGEDFPKKNPPASDSGAAAAEFSARALPGFLQMLGSISSPNEALLEAFIKTDVAFRSVLGSLRKSRGAIKKDWHPGCTAVAALIVRNKLFVANAGDCRTILCRAGRAHALSKDHVASCLEERERVISSGGEVKWQIDTWRVGPAALQILIFGVKPERIPDRRNMSGRDVVELLAWRSVTRSIGDDDLKPAVTAEPEITEVMLSVEDEYLVMASDGLWDVMSNVEVVSIIKDTVKEAGMCSKRLATEAAERGSKDNITVIVVFLRPVSTAERIY
ncbi:hypothetical protein RJ640_025095 [Escallonia rubra]|uniref:Protein kinase and PP2C-like domain-containing protein n=1 Tax=Escallonia rubra TaxID=112253 RepID=A0AA88RES5_9ASTE|nr:hypothetical protein RJ640_025095 [Escallonia rubra]